MNAASCENAVYYSKIVTGGSSFAVTVTLNGLQYGFVIGHEISGSDDAVAPITNKNAQTNVATTTDLITSNTVTPTRDGAYIMGFTTNSTQDGTAANTGTNFNTAETPNDSGISGKSEYLIQTSAAAIAAKFTAAAATKNWGTTVIAFVPVASVAVKNSNFLTFMGPQPQQ